MKKLSVPGVDPVERPRVGARADLAVCLGLTVMALKNAPEPLPLVEAVEFAGCIGLMLNPRAGVDAGSRFFGVAPEVVWPRCTAALEAAAVSENETEVGLTAAADALFAAVEPFDAPEAEVVMFEVDRGAEGLPLTVMVVIRGPAGLKNFRWSAADRCLN
jgi:hypothetical protein